MPDFGVHEPFDLIRLSISERVLVKLRGDRELRGVLHAYDGHMNLIMGDVEESIYDVQVSEDTGAETIKVGNSCQGLTQIAKRNAEMMFVRGDSVILVRAHSMSLTTGLAPAHVSAGHCIVAVIQALGLQVAQNHYYLTSTAFPYSFYRGKPRGASRASAWYPHALHRRSDASFFHTFSRRGSSVKRSLLANSA